MATLRDLAARLAQAAAGRPVLLAGPTAGGKSALALALAQDTGATIINADALQVYDCWRVLTARPGPADLGRAPHALYGHLPRDAEWSVGHWLRAVAPYLHARPAPVIVGGTGLYFTALTQGLAEIPPIPHSLRAEAEARWQHNGLAPLIAALDPATRARIDTANPARVLRAWEVWRATGRGLADWQAATPPPLLPRDAALAVVVEVAPEILAARIDRRFDAMMADGALEEVRAELPHWDAARPSARAIGAAELVAHLQGATALPDAVAAAKTATRRYAKRQRTWLRNRLGDWSRVAAGG